MTNSNLRDEEPEAPVTPAETDRNENPSADEIRRNWPGKSEPGHIRPVGPAYRREPEKQTDSPARKTA